MGLFLPHIAAAVEPAAPAAEAPELVWLHYDVGPGCPTEAQFVDEVLARVRRPVQFGATGASVEMVVTVGKVGEQASGKLEVERKGAAPTRRDFTGASCDEVGSALALVAALSLDPNARTEPLPVRAASTETPPVAASLEPPPPVAPTPSAPPPVPTQAPPVAPPAHFVVWMGPHAGIIAGDAPKPLGLFGLSLGVRSVSPGPLSPGLQLTPLWGETGVTGPKTSQGDFSWALVRLEACPVSWTLAEHVRLDPCAAAEVGRLSARGAAEEVDVPVTAERWWAAGGASLSLHLGFRGWFVRLGGLALFPATRDEFVFLQPDRTVHQASVVVAGGDLALGFQLGE